MDDGVVRERGDSKTGPDFQVAGRMAIPSGTQVGEAGGGEDGGLSLGMSEEL